MLTHLGLSCRSVNNSSRKLGAVLEILLAGTELEFQFNAAPIRCMKWNWVIGWLARELRTSNRPRMRGKNVWRVQQTRKPMTSNHYDARVRSLESDYALVI